ncbi:MAG TPA: zf-HC2 domain-containing protein [Pontimonas sp.]|nr:zf-HC2 domain-containing protein [Pontimonas sp.]
MADCGCEETRDKLEDYLHGELPDGACQDLEDHFQECPPCCDERDVGNLLTEKVKSACCETAPEELKLSIQKTLESAS